MAWDIIGHNWAVDLLSKRLATGRSAHAYLFTGPPHVGKTRLARTLAQAVNCEQAEAPCGQCRSCIRIEKGQHPDVHLFEGEGVGGSIKIDQIRALQREAMLTPYEGRYRVFILRRADRATLEAADSLLKTLEEPPSQVMLVLTAMYAEGLPATVVSRCQRLDLRPATLSVVETAVRERGVPPPKAELLARLSGGRIGWAFRAAEEDTVLKQREQDLDQLAMLLTSNRVARLDFAWQASRDPEGVRRMLELWTGWWRDLLLLCGNSEGRIVNTDRLDELQSFASQSDLVQVWTALKALQTTIIQLESNVNTRLALENLFLKLPEGRSTAGSRVG